MRANENADHTIGIFFWLAENYYVRSRFANTWNPRPYVYDVGQKGLIARWRGSALAWPLVDATLIHNDKGFSFLCALHRKDSFVVLNPESKETRTAVYQWNGFGFSGVEGPDLVQQCAHYFSASLSFN